MNITLSSTSARAGRCFEDGDGDGLKNGADDWQCVQLLNYVPGDDDDDAFSPCSCGDRQTSRLGKVGSVAGRHEVIST